MPTISLCMIVKNEETVLSKCLNSIKNLADEIIIVDTGSTDKTINIAQQYTSKIYHFKWCDNFSAARNYAFSFATCDYVMWLDADDVIQESELQKLLKLKPHLSADTYMLKYAIAYTNQNPTYTFYRERLLKRSGNPTWEGCVHECITPFGIVEKLDIVVEHRKLKHTQSDRNIKIYEKVISTRPLTPRETYYYGRELFDHKHYKKCINILKGFIKSKLGWIENVIDAHYLIAECYAQLNKHNLSLKYLFKTFYLDVPRANICCKIGDIFLLDKNYDTAISWFLFATNCTDVTYKGGFVDQNYYNFYPFMQLCLCYYNLGNLTKAIEFNNKAEKFNPTNDAVLSNKLYLNNLLKNPHQV